MASYSLGGHSGITAASAASQSVKTTPIQKLPVDLIEKILLPLGLKERVRSMRVCKRFWQVGRQGCLLWENVCCTPQNTHQMGRLFEWIYAHHTKVRRVSVRPPEDFEPTALLSLWGMMAGAFALVSSRLVSLDFQMPTDLELSGWIAPLKELRWLSVTAPRIMVAADVGHLTNLHTLQLTTTGAENATESTIEFAEKSIPVGLRALLLEDMLLLELPPAVCTAAGSLTRLKLDINYSEQFFEEGALPGSTRGLLHLPRLQGLKVLELQHCESHVLPSEMAPLTGLTFLCLSWSFHTNPPQNLLMLSGLSRLQVLNMQYCQLGSLETAQHALNHLQTLCLSGNPGLVLPLESAWLPLLAQLDVDVESAVENCGAIAGMASLRQLCLNGCNSQPQKPMGNAAILAFIASLRSLDHLHTLYFKNNGQLPLTATVETVAAFSEFLRRRPIIEIKAAPRSVGNPFDASWLTWDRAGAGGDDGSGDDGPDAGSGAAGTNESEQGWSDKVYRPRGGERQQLQP